jgi:hypothetical protein
MNDAPARQPLGLQDCYGMIATTVCWLLLALALAVGSLEQLPLSVAVKAFASILCGPFAFFDCPQMPWTAKLAITTFCAASIVLHLLIREVQTAFIAAVGISLWFMVGLGMTFISV